MPIRIQNSVDPAVAGRLAYEGGLGLYNLDQQREAEKQRQFDTQIGQRESQFARNLQYQYDLASLTAGQKQQAMQQDAYQFDAGLASREGMAGDNRQFSYDMQQQQLGAAQEGREFQAKQQMSRDARGVIAKKQQQMTEIGANRAMAIEKHQYRNKEQKQQVVDQWVEGFGEYFGGKYPFATPFEANPNQIDIGMIDAEVGKLAG